MHGKMYTKLMNSKEWKQVRIAKLTAQPLCESCARKGYVRGASVVHHIREVESGKTELECRTLCFTMSNLMSLCKECHKEIHLNRGTWKKENHLQREEERLAAWIDKHSK